MRRLAALALTATLAAAPALACDDELQAGGETSYLDQGVFTYDVFEASVAHSDLASCPAEFDPDVVFCRFATTENAANIFVFSYEGDMPLLAIKHMPIEDAAAIQAAFLE